MTAPSPPDTPKRAVLRHVRPADLKAAAQLAAQATHGVINITEGVHQAVRRRLGFSAGATTQQASGLTGQIYQVVRGVTRLVGWGTEAALGALLPLVDDPATVAAAAAELTGERPDGLHGLRLTLIAMPPGSTVCPRRWPG